MKRKMKIKPLLILSVLVVLFISGCGFEQEKNLHPLQRITFILTIEGENYTLEMEGLKVNARLYNKDYSINEEISFENGSVTLYGKDYLGEFYLDIELEIEFVCGGIEMKRNRFIFFLDDNEELDADRIIINYNPAKWSFEDNTILVRDV